MLKAAKGYNYFDLGSAPAGEVQDFSIAQAIRFKSMIHRLPQFGKSEADCFLSIAEEHGKRFVRVYFNFDDAAALAYAMRCKDEMPNEWCEQACQFLNISQTKGKVNANSR